jgi:hypothetical protein
MGVTPESIEQLHVSVKKDVKEFVHDYEKTADITALKNAWNRLDFGMIGLSVFCEAVYISVKSKVPERYLSLYKEPFLRATATFLNLFDELTQKTIIVTKFTAEEEGRCAEDKEELIATILTAFESTNLNLLLSAYRITDRLSMATCTKCHKAIKN